MHTFFLVGCDSSFTITYPRSLASSYVVTLTAGSWRETFPCPSSDGMVALDGGDFYPYQCEAASFVLLWPGGDRSDAGVSTITFDVTIAEADGGVTTPPTTVVGALGSTFQPNGPQCGPTCLAFVGFL